MNIKKFIPDFVTSLNVVCGIIGIVFAFKGRCDIAFLLMIAAAVFDFLDGFAARALHAYSDLGKELDSLCDLVSFGVLPSVMLFVTSSSSMMHDSWVPWTALLIAVFSALRLAKFNVDKRQSDSFLGLPTPACALLSGAVCCHAATNTAGFFAIWMSGDIFVPVLSVALCILLVCEIPMFSFKFHRDDSKLMKFKRLLFIALVIVSVAVCWIFHMDWTFVIIFSMSCYILKNVVYWVAGLE